MNAGKRNEEWWRRAREEAARGEPLGPYGVFPRRAEAGLSLPSRIVSAPEPPGARSVQDSRQATRSIAHQDGDADAGDDQVERRPEDGERDAPDDLVQHGAVMVVLALPS